MAHNSEITGEQAKLQSSLNSQITDLNNKMNAGWQGKAADQAVSGAAPLATSADTASSSLTQASKAMSDQVHAFTTAYNSVVPMSNSAPQNNIANEFVSAFGVNTPLDQQINQYNADGQHNVAVYNNYSTQSSANAAQMPTSFDTLPEPHPTVSVIPDATPGGATYGTFTSPSGVGGGPVGGYPVSGTPRSGAPVWTNPSGPSGGGPTSRVTTPTGPGGWEPPPGGGVPLTTTPSDYVPGGSGPGGGPGFPDGGFPGPGGYPGGPQGDDPYYPGGPGFGNPNQEEDQQYPGGGLPGPNGAFPEQSGGIGGGGFGGGGGGFGGAGGAGGPAGPGATSSASTGGPGGLSPAGEQALAARGGMFGVPTPGAPGEGGGMFPPGRGGKGEEDKEHKTAEYLQEADPDALFGSDQMTVPPVLGE
jgi:hypothetical protein